MSNLSRSEEEALYKALRGKSESAGGLNLPKLKKLLALKLNVVESEFDNMKRVDIEKHGLRLLPSQSSPSKSPRKSPSKSPRRSPSKSPRKSPKKKPNMAMVKGEKVEVKGDPWKVKGESGLTVKEENYCRCLAHTSLNENLTPEAICRNKVKPGKVAYEQGERYHYPDCIYYYANYYKLPPNELKSLSKYHKKTVADFQAYINTKKE